MAADPRHRRLADRWTELWGASRCDASSSTRATCSGSSQVGTWPQPVSVTWRASGSSRRARGALARVDQQPVLLAPGDGDRAARAPARRSGGRSIASSVVSKPGERARLRSAPAASSAGIRHGRATRWPKASVRRTGPPHSSSACAARQLRDAPRARISTRARVAPLAHRSRSRRARARRPSAPSPARAIASATAPPSELPAACAPPSPMPVEELRHRAGQRLDRRPRVELRGVPEAGQVDRDDLALAAHAVEHRLPHLPLRADAVDQDERRPAAAADVGERHVAEA